MRKVVMWVMAVGFLFVFSSPSFAILRKDRDVARGKVVSINAANKEVTIKDSTTNQDVLFTVRKGVDPSLQIGTEVNVFFIKGTNIATSVAPRRKR